MSSHVSSEQVCYVHCNFCNTVLVVNVPCLNPFNIVTVRCGHCANLLSVNLGAMLQKHPFQDLQSQNIESQVPHLDFGSSSRCTRIAKMNTAENIQRHMLPVRPTSEKRQRVPSAYNKFIKEEIRRLKAINPEISHREAFSAAAKNWAHFPRIHFGLSINGGKQV